MSPSPFGRRPVACCAFALAILLAVGLHAPAEATDNAAHPTIAAAEVDGDALDMLFTAKLDTSSVPVSGDFTAAVDGDPREVLHVQVPNRHFARLTLSARVVEGETVTVSYTPGERPLRSRDGADVESFSGQPARNLTPSSTWRRAQAQRSSDTWSVVATFSGALDPDSVPSPDDFTITVNGLPGRPVAMGRGLTSRPTLRESHSVPSGTTIATAARWFRSNVSIRMAAPAIGPGDVVTMSHISGETPLRDIDGNKVESFGPVPVVNTFDPARLSSTDVDGTVLFMGFDQFITHSKLPAPADFAVAVDGAPRSVERVHSPGGVTATFLVLVLSAPVAAGEAVTLSYTKGETPLQEEYGDEIESFGPVPVKNVGGRPEFDWAEVNGSTLSVWLHPSPDIGVVPSAADFTVTVDGSNRVVDGVSIGFRSSYTLAREVRLTLEEPVDSDDTVTVAYAPGVSPFRHEGGDMARGFDRRPVANVTAPAIPVHLPELRPLRTIVSISGSVADLRGAAMEACELGVEIYATVDGDIIPFFPRLHGRIVNLAFEEAFADGLDDELLIFENCRTPYVGRSV